MRQIVYIIQKWQVICRYNDINVYKTQISYETITCNFSSY